MPLTLPHRPIFVIGAERSGTTLVMTMLGAHPDIAVPEVAWFYPWRGAPGPRQKDIDVIEDIKYRLQNDLGGAGT